MAFSVKIVMPSHPRVLSVARSTVGQFATAVGFSEEECRTIVLAVDEALTNIIRHAYHGRTDGKIELTCQVAGGEFSPDCDRQAGQIEFVLDDYGTSVDPAALKGRDLEDVRPGGLGIHFIRAAMDEVEYVPHGEYNRLRLLKHVARKQ